MRYIWAFIWSFLLTQMVFYVLGNMGGDDYSFVTAFIVGLFIAAFVIILGEGAIPPDSETNHQ